MKVHADRFPAAALAACALGLATCPLIYVAIGALSQFRVEGRLVMLPPFVAALGFLLWRYLRRPSGAAVYPRLVVGLELASWLAIGGFLFIVSGISLARGRERFGAVSSAFLVASIVWLPVVLVLERALEDRLRRAPRGPAAAVLLVVLAAAAFGVVTFLTTPSAFV